MTLLSTARDVFKNKQTANLYVHGVSLLYFFASIFDPQ